MGAPSNTQSNSPSNAPRNAPSKKAGNQAGKARIMAHMVAGYPDYETSFSIAQALLDGGVTYLEVQFPFSDPTADGPVIQEACTAALAAGFTIEKGFTLIKRISRTTDVPLFVMSYGSLVYAYGVGRFCERAVGEGAAGLIVPDLMPGSDEGLYDAGERTGVHVVPVVVPSIRENRLDSISELSPEFLYTALRAGVTGSRTDVAESVRFLEWIDKKMDGTKIVAGFGIRSREQVEQLQHHVHGVVVGSFLVRTITEAIGKDARIYQAVREVTENLVYG